MIEYHNQMFELLAQLGKFFDSPLFMGFIIIVGYLVIDRAKFSRIIIALMSSIVLGALLKSIFKMPLPGNIAGYGFPSGHLFTTCVLWFYISLEFNNKITSTIGILICSLVAYKLLYYNYHYAYDLLGAVFFALLWCWVVYGIYHKIVPQKQYLVAIIFGIISIIILPQIGGTWMYYKWGATAIILGIALGEFLTEKNNFKNDLSKKFKILSLIIGGGGIIIFYILLNFITDHSINPIFTFCELLFLTLWVSFLTNLIINSSKYLSQ